MVLTPDFANPPVIEFVLGVQFSPLENLTTGHFGLFWDRLGRLNWPIVGDSPPLEQQFELFEQPQWRLPMQLQFKFQPGFQPGRFTLQNSGRDRMIQLQDSRLLLNWRRQVSEDRVRYPSYKVLIGDFEKTFSLFSDFAEEHQLGGIRPNQWEITYVDSFPQGELWQTAADWERILPGLFGKLSTNPNSELVLEHRAAEWSYEITPKRGRLHINAQAGFVGEPSRPSLLLNITARGPIVESGISSIREGLDLGHAVSLNEFLAMVSPNVKSTWEKRK